MPDFSWIDRTASIIAAPTPLTGTLAPAIPRWLNGTSKCVKKNHHIPRHRRGSRAVTMKHCDELCAPLQDQRPQTIIDGL